MVDQPPASPEPNEQPQTPPAPPAPPYGSAPQAPQAPAAAYPAPVAYGYAPPTNALAIVSLVASLVGLFVLPMVGQIVGVITGHMALSQIRQRGEGGRGMALAGTIIGWVSIGLAVLGIVIAIIVLVSVAGAGATFSSSVS